MNPTKEQVEILEAGVGSSQNLQLIAYAGCGKSTTLQALDRALGSFPRLYLAFNSKIVKDMEEPDEEGKPKLGPLTTCRTLNSLGHRAWAATLTKKVVLNKTKTLDIFRAYVKAQPRDVQSTLWDEYDAIRTGVDLAKAYGYIPQGMMNWERRLIDADFLDYIDEPISVQSAIAIDNILRLSIRQSYLGDIEFNDQLYMPTLFGGSFPKYPLVYVDEYQDLSPINHAMVAKVVGNDGRLIAAGDPFQSIYAFRGAMTDGMATQQRKFSMETMPLSHSFRCPEEIVKNARWRAPGFAWIKSGGTVQKLHSMDLSRIADGSAIVCRNNAPLFRLAINLLSAGRSVSMAGTDIGPRLLGILRRLGDASMSRSAVLDAIDHWEEQRLGSKTAADVAACLQVFAELGDTLGEALSHAETLLKQTGRIYLTTGHKAKGLEWDTVYHLDPGLIGHDEQELNLRYVIQTRSKDRYFEIDSAGLA